MDMLPSLCAAMERASGDCLILREGQPPHVLAGTTRHDVARAVLSHNALEALVGRIFSESARHALAESGHAVESVDVPGMNLSLLARVESVGQELSIELSRTNPVHVSQPVVAEQSRSDLAVTFSVTTPEPSLDEPQHSSEPQPATDAPMTSNSSLAQHNPVETDSLRTDDPWKLAPSTTFDASTSHSHTPEPAYAPSSAPLIPTVSPAPFAPVESFPVAQPPVVHAPAVAESTGAVGATDSAGLMRWVAKAASCNATALYLRAGTAPVARVEERLEPLGTELIDASLIEQFLITLDSGVDRLWQPGADGEWIRNEDALGRVSCKFFADDLGPGLVVRLRRQPSPSVLHRHIPRKVKGACDGDGLIVVSAATPADLLGIASAVADYAGRRRGGYVIALRPEGTPRHDITGSFVSQRELTTVDAEISAAIRNAAAESPDVMLIAPPHSDIAMREAIHATDGGRLVILAVLAPTSMHALRAVSGRSGSGTDAPNRLALATSFRAAFSYRGVRRLGGGRTLIQDLVVGTSDISAMLAAGDFAGITRIQRSGSVGMHTVDDTLARAVKRGHLSLRQAATQAVDRRHFVALVRAARRNSPANGSRSSRAKDPVLLEDLLQAVGSTAQGSRRRWSAD